MDHSEYTFDHSEKLLPDSSMYDDDSQTIISDDDTRSEVFSGYQSDGTSNSLIS